MKRCILVVSIILFFSSLSFAQIDNVVKKSEWHGYAQLRGYSNFNDNHGFMLRRLKLWVKSSPDFSEHWSYEVRTTFSSLRQEMFFLQDVRVQYKTGQFSFDVGQFIPAYSLQWMQSDTKMAPIERDLSVNLLSANGITLGVRDIGVQANYVTKNKVLKTNFGVFNGYGINEYRYSNNGHMFVHRLELNFKIQKSNLKVGYSLQQRKAVDLKIRKVLTDTVAFTGNEFRYNFFILFKTNHFEFQSEFLNANFEGERAFGYYFQPTITLDKNQAFIAYGNYHDVISTTDDVHYVRFGYNRLIKSYKTKLSIDTYVKLNNTGMESATVSLQLQMFLN